VAGDEAVQSRPPQAAHVVPPAHNPAQAGRYLVLIGGCNDCHTPGWNESGGKTPESDWLTGVPLGWRGPWGTTYPANLRLTAQTLSEDGWVKMLHTRNARPPMPWASVNAMSDADLRALYQFIKTLGPKGDPMPPALPPTTDPKGPYLNLQPVMPK
jgi:mono/diheme cytochrome c family protein